jgi:hypothetical protein
MRVHHLVLLACPLPTFAQNIPRMPDGKPNFSGLWQTITTAYWNIEDHSSAPGPFFQLGATGAIPPGLGIVEGGSIPYKPEALAQKQKNLANRLKEDPEAKCYMPGVPRATYMPYPFQIVQGTEKILIAYEFATSNRTVQMKTHASDLTDSWMGTSNGKWDGDTLVVEVTGLNGKSWLDRSGNFTSNKAHITERYTMTDPTHVQYEATINDPDTFTRPWKINLPIYKIVEKNAQMLEFKCVEFAEELLYGDLTKKK